MLSELEAIESGKVDEQRKEIMKEEKQALEKREEEEEKLKLVIEKKLQEREHLTLQFGMNILFSIFVYNEIIILSGRSHIRMTVYYGIFFLVYFVFFGIYITFKKVARLSLDCLKGQIENGSNWDGFQTYYTSVFLIALYIPPAFIEHCLWMAETLLYYPHGLFRAIVEFVFSFWDNSIEVQAQEWDKDLQFQKSVLEHKTSRYRKGLKQTKVPLSNIYSRPKELEALEAKNIGNSKTEVQKTEIDKLLSMSLPFEETIDPSST
jgi:hypothetical protein